MLEDLSIGVQVVQYPLGLSSTSKNFGITFCRCCIYLLHISRVRVCQNCSIPFISSFKLVGL